MSKKLATISLPNGRKQSENSYLKLLLYLLHEHTIDDLQEQTVKDCRLFNDRFISLHRICRREYCSSFLWNLIENSADKKQLEILTQLGIIRSAIENAYRANSASKFSADSVEKPLQKLLNLTTRRSRLISIWSLEDLDIFDQFGGLYVLLDLLFLDYRFRNLKPEFVTSAKVIMTLATRKIVLKFIYQLICYRDSVKMIFLKGEVLLTLLADNYRYHCNDIDRKHIETSVASSFGWLAHFKSHPDNVDYGPSGIVTSLTETAVTYHTQSHHKQVINRLGGISWLLRRRSGCRVDFLAVDGSIDMLLDLYSAEKLDFYRYTAKNPYKPLKYFILTCLLFAFEMFLIWLTNLWHSTVLPFILFLSICICSTGIETFIKHSFKMEVSNADLMCELSSRILIDIAGDLHTRERALERFRQRDACQLLAHYIISANEYRNKYWTAISFLSLMISGHQLRRMGDIEVERRRLQELNLKKTIKSHFAVHQSNTAWAPHFNTILQFLEN